MASINFDIVDNLLRIGSNDYSDSILTTQFHDLSSTVSPLTLIYMLYSSILTLPLTKKMQDSNIDAIFVRKVSTNLKVVISYKTAEGGLSLKAVDIDASITPKFYPMNNVLLKNVFQKLKKMKQSPTVTPSSFIESVKELHRLTFSFLFGRGPVIIKASTSKQPLEIDPNFLQSSRMSNGFVQVRPSLYGDVSLSHHLDQLNSESTSAIKFNGYGLTKILISKYEDLCKSAKLSTLEKKVYAFIFGSLKFNWEKSHNLKIETVLAQDSYQSIQEIRIRKILPTKGWLSTSIPLIFKMLHTHLDATHADYLDQMSLEVRSLSQSTLATNAQQVVVAGVDYSNLLQSLRSGAVRDNLHPSPLTFVEEVYMDPYENIVDALLRMNFVQQSDQLLARFNYCIRRLNRQNPHGFQSFFLGQLMAHKNSAVNKYFFHHEDQQQSVTSIVLKFRSSENGALVDIIEPVQNTDLLFYSNKLVNKIPPLGKLNLKKVVRMVVDPTQVSYMNELDVDDYLNTEQIFKGYWQPILDLWPEHILQSLKNTAEAFHRLDPTESLPMHIKSMQNDLFRGKEHVMSKDDIRLFLVGVFTDYKTFFYDNADFLGIMTKDDAPVFLSVTDAKVADHEQVLSQKLIAVAKKYVVDYSRDEFKRIATFTSLAYDPDESNGFSLSKFTSFGVNKDAFESCIPGGSRIRRSTISCFHEDEEETIKFVPLQNTELLEYGIEDSRSYYQTFKDRMQPSLDIVGKFSKILMAAEIFKDMVSALIRGDYKSFAVNVAFLASGPLMEALSTRMVASGYRSLLVTAPFLCRLPTMAFIGYDLFEQIEDYKAGNLDAKVNIVGDASILAIEFTTASVEVAESLGLVAGVSETLGPIGLAVGTAIFIGTDIYSSVKTVEKIDHLVHLTSWQKFTTGFLSFLHLPPTKTVREEMRIESIVSAATKNAANFFAQHPQIRYYIFPSYRNDGNFMENNNVSLSNRDFSTSNEVGLICIDEYFQEKYIRHVRKNFHCRNMLGFESTSNDTKTLIMLGNGNDTATAFPDSSSTFLIGNGFKDIVGSKKSDIFILNGSEIHGHLDGHSGDDMINLANFATGQSLQVNLNHVITFNNGSIKIKNIANVIGRWNVQDIVQCACETRYLDLLGGSSSSLRDYAMIPFSLNCSYNMKIEITGFFHLENNAKMGHFQYILSKSHGVVVKVTRKSEITNLFAFHNNIDNLDLIRVSFNNSSSINLYNLLIKTNSSTLEIEGVDDNAIYSFEDDAQLRIVNGTVTVSMVSNATIENIYTRGLNLSRRLNAVVNIFALKHNTSMLFGGGNALIHNTSNEISHMNMLPSDPYHATYLVGGGSQNIFRISVPDLHNSSASPANGVNLVNILNYANKDHPSILDLYEIVFLVHEKFHGKVNISIERREANLHMQINAFLQMQNISLVNVTLDKAYENNAYQYILINMHRPMRISVKENEKTVLIPLDYHMKNVSHALIHAGMIDPFTTVVSTKNIYDYETFIHENSTLVLTNVNGILDNNDLVFIVFKDLLIDVELQTLRVTFADQTVSFLDHIDEILRESDDFEEVFGSVEEH